MQENVKIRGRKSRITAKINKKRHFSRAKSCVIKKKAVPLSSELEIDDFVALQLV
jgi:hypothetical protein